MNLSIYIVVAFVLMLSVPPSQAAPWDQRVKETYKEASDTHTFRSLRRVGFGGSAAGPLGAVGANIELNFTHSSGLVTGFGGGPGFQAFTFQYKRTLGGEALLPYMAAGYARWYTPGSSKMDSNDTMPSFLADRFMSAEDKKTGRIDKNLIFPTIGIQYVQLDGDLAGYSIFAEALVLLDINDFVAAPTGTVGMLYYF